jgi:flagellar hook-basal body complex protein FliE
MPIDPSFAVSGADWQIAPVEAPNAAAGANSGFGQMLGDSIQSLTNTQTEAASASQALATGQASDPTAVVMAVERAQLAMQLASQIRTKAVEAAQDIFHTQV